MRLLSNIALLAILAAVPAQATVVISSSFLTSSTMPGSPTDFTFFGNPIQFPAGGPDISDNYHSGVAMQPTLFTNFTPHVGASAQYTYGVQNDNGTTNYDSTFGTITTPGGIAGAQKTGILYSTSNTAPDLVRFTLGPTTPNFNFANFDVYVMISNAPTSGLDDSALFASVYNANGAIVLASAMPFVTDGITSTGTALFEDFHITGAASGEILQLGALSANQNGAYISGVSFFANSVPTPEPSTYAMILGSLALLGLGVRVGRKSVAL